MKTETLLRNTTALLFCILISSGVAAENKYLWAHADTDQAIMERFAPPDSFTRIDVPSGSYADWLRHLPLIPPGRPMVLANHLVKQNQNAHAAIVDIDYGLKNYQQAPQCVMRLRAEYLYSRGFNDSIVFSIAGRDTASFRDWITGYRPLKEKNEFKWSNQGKVDSSYSSFRIYLDSLFRFSASPYMLAQVNSVDSVKDMQIGDFFFKSAYPGHSAVVVDMVENKETGKKLFLLAQGFMPAQGMYVNKNPVDSTLSPWFPLDFGDSLKTPEWTFDKKELRRFK